MAIELIAKIAPKAGGFTGMVDADQVIGTSSGGGYVPDDAISSSSITQHETNIDHNNLLNYTSSEHFTKDSIALNDLSDTSLGTPSQDDVLTYDTASSKWTASAQGGGVTDHGELTGLSDNDHPQYLLTASATLDILTDTSLGSPSHNDVLTYDSGSSMWTSSAGGGLSQEQVEDYAGNMIANTTGTHTGISITYQDATNDMDFIVDHNAASNYVANEHIDHSSLAITTSGILGGGGNLTTSQTLSLTHSDVDHDQTTNFVANEHVDHSSLAVTSSGVLSGGGNLTTSQTLSLTHSDIDHNQTTNFVSDEHVDHSTLSITTSGILSGGGNLTTSQTISLTHSDIDHNQLTNYTSSEHFTEASIDHTAIQNIGTNSHAVIDTHLTNSSIHFSDLSGFDTDDLTEGSTNLYSQWEPTGSGLFYGSDAPNLILKDTDSTGDSVLSTFKFYDQNDLDIGYFGFSDSESSTFFVSNRDGPLELNTYLSGDIILNPHGDIDIYSNTIKNVADPTADQHAATKKYVDDNKYTDAEAVSAVATADDYLKNDEVDVGVGLTLTGDNSSSDTAYVPMVLYNTDDTPPTASNFPIGTIYLQYTA
ncbi:MAG: hypothetical protein ACTSPI_07985 [Candidatus Heimdallarchaeaceae archaeon]